ncbi:MAG: hypothetical protein IJ958_08325 [Agathobacter sp.]|nr:hypothetical protein [Agathobacter sp.]
MERIRKLNSYQKVVLIVMVAMSLMFAMIYLKTIARVGYKYNDAILVPTVEDGETVYSGKIKGEQAQFIVSNDNTVVFNYGDKTYGPYTVTEDITAIPEDNELNESMTGIEVREGNDILFRGGVMNLVDYYMFYNEDGTSNGILISYVTSDGIEWDENGNPIDRMKPSLSTIYELTQNPELTHKGVGFIWFIAVFVCIMNALSILFADELFRLKLAFSVQNVDNVEPSEWAISARYIGWTTMAIIALVIFIMGLR